MFLCIETLAVLGDSAAQGRVKARYVDSKLTVVLETKLDHIPYSRNEALPSRNLDFAPNCVCRSIICESVPKYGMTNIQRERGTYLFVSTALHTKSVIKVWEECADKFKLNSVTNTF